MRFHLLPHLSSRNTSTGSEASMRKEVDSMKRRILPLFCAVVLLCTFCAQALDQRVSSGRPNLTFSGTTALCNALCRSGTPTDTVEATLTLYQGRTYIDSWSDSGTGKAMPSGSCSVKSGKRYRLVLTYSINGVSKPSVEVFATCP